MTTTVPPYRIGPAGQTLPLNSEETPESFLVPRFRVELDGSDLPVDVVHDVVEVKYTDSIRKIDSFDLVLSNYDSQSGKPKYEPPISADYKELFDPGKKLKLYMGYADHLQLMLTGQITTLEPNFPANGGLTLSVRGLNELHKFCAAHHTHSWENTRDSDIAVEIGRRKRSSQSPGLDIEVRVNPRDDEQPDEYVFMKNQYDIVFLMQRARRWNYELVLHEETTNGRVEQYLSFGSSVDTEAAVYLLEWGKSLLRFRPTLNTSKQVGAVVVTGWDRRRNRKIEEVVTWEDVLPRHNPAERRRQQQIVNAFRERFEQITDRDVRNAQQARTVARSTLNNIKQGLVTAQGETIGLPKLRAGRKLEIQGVGDRFSGMYYIEETTHAINASGYKTQFTLRREEGNAP